jgi:hypothetical protein
MLRLRPSAICLLTSVTFLAGCGKNDAAAPMTPPGAGGAMGPPGMPKPGGMDKMPKPPGMGMMGAGGAGAIVIGVPQPGSPGTVFPGGGLSGGAPLAPGCTPASAHECPSASGTCATSATAKPTGTTSGSICFYGPITTTTTTTTSTPAATIEYLSETAGGQSYYRFRITFDPAFVDNTYGANAIGWGTKGHTFKDLVGSDHAELSLFDGGSALVSMFDLDYITANSASACGYGALGVRGGEGKMLTGDATYILAATTSLDRDLNGCGYCRSAACGGDCTVDSPATDAAYTPNPSAPAWDYRVIYEVWVDAAVFAGKGFGGASITFVHASPSKASSNTVSVTPRPCGGGCPEGYVALASEGGVCVPKDGGCPQGYVALTSEGGVCVPVPKDGVCPSGYTTYLTSEGASCLPVPKDGVCPGGFTYYLMSEGASCVPTPADGTCPSGYHLDSTSEGSRCL